MSPKRKQTASGLDRRIRGFTAIDSIFNFRQFFLHAWAWGTNDYKRLPEHDRTEFADMVKEGDLFLTARSFAHVCIRHGIDLSRRAPQALNAMPRLGAIRLGKPASRDSRDAFSEAEELLYPIEVELDAAAIELPDDTTPPEVSGPQRAVIDAIRKIDRDGSTPTGDNIAVVMRKSPDYVRHITGPMVNSGLIRSTKQDGYKETNLSVRIGVRKRK